MAIVLALLIVGWLLAFALGAQSGFDTQPEPAKPAVKGTRTAAPATYSEPASAS